LLVGYVSQHRAHEAVDIDTGMLEKATVLNREYRVDQHGGDLIVTQYFTSSGL
jgi:hypothetical protein